MRRTGKATRFRFGLISPTTYDAGWLADRFTLRQESTRNAPTIKFDRNAGRNGRGTQTEADAGKLPPDELLFDVP